MANTSSSNERYWETFNPAGNGNPTSHAEEGEAASLKINSQRFAFEQTLWGDVRSFGREAHRSVSYYPFPSVERSRRHFSRCRSCEYRRLR